GCSYVEPVKIDVIQKQSSRMWIDERKRGTRDILTIDSQSRRDSFDEHRFARAERPVQQNDFAAPEFAPEALAHFEGLAFAVRNDLARRNGGRGTHGLECDSELAKARGKETIGVGAVGFSS